MKIESDFSSFTWNYEAHIAELTGLAKLLRLSTIYSSATRSLALQENVASVLVGHLLNSSCSGFLRRISGDCLSMLKANPHVIEWERNTDLQMLEVLTVLEQELHQAKATAVKENIRTSYLHVGLHYWQWGRIEDALKHFVKSREFASTPQHHIDVNLRMISCYLDIGQLVNTAAFCNKIQDLAQDSATLVRSKALLGLFSLFERSYTIAAQRFLQLDGDIGQEWSFLFTASDVGFYGALAGLLAYNRRDIQVHLLENKSFQHLYLQHQPELKNLIASVYGHNDYRCVLSFLQWLHTRLLLDVHLQSSVSEIIQTLHDKFFVQYLEPFAAVTVTRLMEDFQCTASQEQEVRSTLIDLVTSHKIQARIDFRAGKILRGVLATSTNINNNSNADGNGNGNAQDAHKRRQLLANMMIMQEEHVANLKRSLFLLSLRKTGLMVEGPPTHRHKDNEGEFLSETSGGGNKAARMLMGGGRRPHNSNSNNVNRNTTNNNSNSNSTTMMTASGSGRSAVRSSRLEEEGGEDADFLLASSNDKDRPDVRMEEDGNDDNDNEDRGNHSDHEDNDDDDDDDYPNVHTNNSHYRRGMMSEDDDMTASEGGLSPVMRG